MLLLCLEPGQTALDRDCKGGQGLACWPATELPVGFPDWPVAWLYGQLNVSIAGSLFGLLAVDVT